MKRPSSKDTRLVRTFVNITIVLGVVLAGCGTPATFEADRELVRITSTSSVNGDRTLMTFNEIDFCFADPRIDSVGDGSDLYIFVSVVNLSVGDTSLCEGGGLENFKIEPALFVKADRWLDGYCFRADADTAELCPSDSGRDPGVLRD